MLGRPAGKRRVRLLTPSHPTRTPRAPGDEPPLAMSPAPFLPRPRRALALALALLAGAAPAAGQWEDVDLPRGFRLELASGRVANQLPPDAPHLVYRAGRLESAAALYRLPTFGAEPRPRIERGIGEAVAGVEARPGAELVYDLGAQGWGYLRVLAVGAERVRLERVHSEPEARALARQPLALAVRAGDGGLTLSWREAGPAGGSYLVERRFLPRGPDEPDAGWESLAEVRGHAWLDERASPTRVAEYRVRALGDRAAPFGARARGVLNLHGSERPVPVARGMDLSLLTLLEDPARVDVRIQHANESLVQLAPGPGVLLRNLAPAEEDAWRLPDVSAPDWTSAAVFAGPGRGLAAHLPEGIYVRLRVEIGPGGEPRLSRQIDLAGGRMFPPPPPRARAAWDADAGLTLRLDAAPDAPDLGLPRPEFAIELEEEFESGLWRPLAVQPAARELLLGHLVPAGLARLRLRYRLAGGELSLPNLPTSVLVGDDGGPGSEELLERALVELTSPDYAVRRRAQGTLEVLGSRVAPRLRESLAAEDPQLAAAARELLGRLGADAARDPGAGAPLAPLILRAEAEARRLFEEPPPGWFEPGPARRALAILRHLAGRPASHLESWRELSAAADPDPRVRRLASLAPTLTPPPEPPDWIERLPRAAPEPPVPGSAHDGPAQDDPREAARALAATVDWKDPWASLVRLGLVHELGGALGGAREAAALQHARLGLGLLQRHRTDPQPAFLEAARRLVEDPAARLAAVRELADRTWAAAERGRAVRELPAADGEALLALLEELGTGEVELDLILPAGVYEPGPGGAMLRVGARGLRLVARGEVVLRYSMYVAPEGEVVLQGLLLAPPSGIALNLVRSSAVLVDCGVVPAQLGVQLSDGFLALLRTEVAREGAASTTAGIRAGGESLVLLRDSLIDAGGAALGGARLVLVERSVLLAGGAPALSAARDGEAWVLDSLLAGGPSAVSGFATGLLEGGLLAAEGPVATQLGEGLLACPEHLLLQGEPGSLGERPARVGCPIGR